MRSSITILACLGISVLSGCGSSDDSNPEDSGPTKGGSSGAGGTLAGGAGTGGQVASGGSVATGGSAGSGTGGNAGSNAGGSAGTGGDGGSAGVPHVVSKCDDLPEPGTWELVSPPEWAESPKNEALQVALSPQNPAIVFAAAGDKTNGGDGGTGIYKSTDCAATWTKISTGTHSADLETGDIWSLKIDPENADKIYVTNGYGSPPSLFRSVNGGVDFTDLTPDGGELATAIGGQFVQGVALDPSDADHVLVTFHFNCTGDYAPMCLAETTDGGTSWRPFKGPTDGWQEGASPAILDPTTFLYGTGSALFYTSDSGDHWEQVANNGYGKHYEAGDGTIYLTGDGGLMKSTDGYSWSSVPNSPKASGLVGDGTHIYAVYQNDFSGKPVFRALESDPTSWTNLETPTIKQGGGALAIDTDHHVFYGAFWQAGLWRYVEE